MFFVLLPTHTKTFFMKKLMFLLAILLITSFICYLLFNNSKNVSSSENGIAQSSQTVSSNQSKSIASKQDANSKDPIIKNNRTEPQDISLNLTREVSVEEVKKMSFENLIDLFPENQRQNISKNRKTQSAEFNAEAERRLRDLVLKHLQDS